MGVRVMPAEMGPDGRGWGAQEVEYDLGYGGPGKSVVINITRSIVVRILDEENYSKYKAGEDCTAFSGRLHSSPYRFPLPRASRWHVVIDPSTYSGIAEFNVRMMDDELLDNEENKARRS